MTFWWFADWSTCDSREHAVWRPLGEGEWRLPQEVPLATSPCDHSPLVMADISVILKGS